MANYVKVLNLTYMMVSLNPKVDFSLMHNNGHELLSMSVIGSASYIHLLE
jgi:hypothetical protein